MATTRSTARRTLTLLGTAVLLGAMAIAPAAAQDHDHDGPHPADEPASFTSMFSIGASAEEVVAGGEPGATGRFDLRLDAESDTICFDIALDGVTPPYESPANTATHIHEGDAGVVGPPRVVFPDPDMNGDGTLTSSGCITGPWMTGVGPDDGGDHGDEFSVAQLEADPSAFYVDTHTTEYPDGAVRGQFGTPLPAGGMDTGDGSALLPSSLILAVGAALLLGLLMVAGLGVNKARQARQHTA